MLRKTKIHMTGRARRQQRKRARNRARLDRLDAWGHAWLGTFSNIAPSDPLTFATLADVVGRLKVASRGEMPIFRESGRLLGPVPHWLIKVPIT